MGSLAINKWNSDLGTWRTSDRTLRIRWDLQSLRRLGQYLKYACHCVVVESVNNQIQLPTDKAQNFF